MQMNKEELIIKLEKGLIDLDEIFNTSPISIEDQDFVDAALYQRFTKLVDIDHFKEDLMPNKEMERILHRLKNAKYIGKTLLNNKKYMNRLMGKCSGYIFKYLPEKARNDKELFEIAIKFTGIKFFHRIGVDPYDKLKYGCLLNNIQTEMSIVQYAGDEIKNDKRLMSLAVNYNPFDFNHLSRELKNDKKVRCSMFAAESNTALIIEDGSINTVQEIESIIKGLSKYFLSISEQSEFMMDVWNEKVADDKKTDKSFLDLLKPFMS